MKGFDIVTLTVNPALDKSTHFKGLVAEQKIRCSEPRFDAGGGGINVSKAISRLGGNLWLYLLPVDLWGKCWKNW